MSRGLRNNNPGNIRLSSTKWQGEVKPSKDNAFCQFVSIKYGYRAMFKTLKTYATKHGCNTIRKMINRYAPSNENHTDNYIKLVCDKAHMQPDVSVAINNKDEMCRIVAAMSFVENGVLAVMNDVEEGWSLL